MNKGKDPVEIMEGFLESVKHSNSLKIEEKGIVMKVKHHYNGMDYKIVLRKFSTGWTVTSVRHLNYDKCSLCGETRISYCQRFLIPGRLYLRANRDKLFKILENHKQTRLLLLF